MDPVTVIVQSPGGQLDLSEVESVSVQAPVLVLNEPIEHQSLDAVESVHAYSMTQVESEEV